MKSRNVRRRTRNKLNTTVRNRAVLPKRCISIILPAHNEARTLRRTLPTLIRWPAVREIIVVANGCTDETEIVARKNGAQVISLPKPCGPDVGRALGARAARGNYLLFLDSDIVWSPRELRPFIQTLQNGTDVALNRYPRSDGRFFHHPTAVAKRTLNLILCHPELEAASFTAVPHAITSHALHVIGWEYLAIPPVAQSRAALNGLRIKAVHYVNVSARNPWNRSKSQRMKELILGDHMQAIAYVIAKRGIRAGFSDESRRRDLIPESAVMSQDHQSHVATVIPACNECHTIASVVRAAKDAGSDKVFVIENGSTDATAATAENAGAQVERYIHPVGHDIGRAIGAMQSPDAACTVFLDADFTIEAEDIRVFRDSVVAGTDVALNRLEKYLPLARQKDAVSTVKRFLNIVLHRDDLGIASLTAVPHALSQRALHVIPPSELAVPPKALVTAIFQNLTVIAPHAVDVVRKNRYRAQAHAAQFKAPLTQLIVGDHIEALAMLLAHRGERAGFIQTRDLSVLKREFNKQPIIIRRHVISSYPTKKKRVKK